MKRREHIGRQLAEMRVDRGLSPETLSWELARAGHQVSGRTIRRIEAGECTPTVRVQFALAAFYGIPIRDLWSPHAAVLA